MGLTLYVDVLDEILEMARTARRAGFTDSRTGKYYAEPTEVEMLGLLAGKDDVVSKVYWIPTECCEVTRVHFRSGDALTIWNAAIDNIKARGEQLLGIVHKHVFPLVPEEIHPAVGGGLFAPSKRDIAVFFAFVDKILMVDSAGNYIIWGAMEGRYYSREPEVILRPEEIKAIKADVYKVIEKLAAKFGVPKKYYRLPEIVVTELSYRGPTGFLPMINRIVIGPEYFGNLAAYGEEVAHLLRYWSFDVDAFDVDAFEEDEVKVAYTQEVFGALGYCMMGGESRLATALEELEYISTLGIKDLERCTLTEIKERLQRLSPTEMDKLRSEVGPEPFQWLLSTFIHGKGYLLGEQIYNRWNEFKSLDLIHKSSDEIEQIIQEKLLPKITEKLKLPEEAPSEAPPEKAEVPELNIEDIKKQLIQAVKAHKKELAGYNIEVNIDFGKIQDAYKQAAQGQEVKGVIFGRKTEDTISIMDISFTKEDSEACIAEGLEIMGNISIKPEG